MHLAARSTGITRSREFLSFLLVSAVLHCQPRTWKCPNGTQRCAMVRDRTDPQYVSQKASRVDEKSDDDGQGVWWARRLDRTCSPAVLLCADGQIASRR